MSLEWQEIFSYNEKMNGCLFCRIVQGEIPSAKLFENERVLAFKDINPQAPVHALVIPKKHLGRLMDATLGDLPLLAELLWVAQQVAQTRGIQHSGFRLVLNNGPDASQVVDHLHVHVLGGRQMGWPPG